MAGRSRFRFATLLRLRKQREDVQKCLVAERIARVSQVEVRMRELGEQIGDQTSALRVACGVGVLPVEHLVSLRNWIGRLRREWFAWSEELVVARERLRLERARLVEVTKQTKVLSMLRQAQEERHRSEVDRREGIELDEIGVQRFLRTLNEAGEAPCDES